MLPLVVLFRNLLLPSDLDGDKDWVATNAALFMSDGHNEHEDSDCKQTIGDIQAEHPDLLFHAVIFRLPDSERQME